MSGPSATSQKSSADWAADILAAAAIVSLLWVWHFPADSVSVTRGGALGLGVWWGALATAAVWWLPSRISLASVGSGSDQTLTTAWDLAICTRFAVRFGPWVLALVYAVSAGWSVRPLDSNETFGIDASIWRGSMANSLHQTVWAWTLACFWTVATRLDHRRWCAPVALVTAAAVGTQALLAVWQHQVLLPNLLDRFLSDPAAMLVQQGIASPRGSAEAMVFENRLRDGGASGTFALANSLAAGLLLFWPMVLDWTLRRWVWIGVSGSTLVAIWLTDSRSAVLAAMIGGAWVVYQRLHRSRRVLAVAMTLGGVAGLGLIATRSAASLSMAPLSVRTRLDYWTATMRLWADHVWLGVGPGNFQAAYQRYRSIQSSENIADPLPL